RQAQAVVEHTGVQVVCAQGRGAGQGEVRLDLLRLGGRQSENFSGRVLGPRTHVDEFFHDLLPGRVQLRQRQCLQSQGVPFFGGGLALGRRKQDEHVGVSTRTRVDGPVHAMTLSESSTPCVGMTTAADPRGGPPPSQACSVVYVWPWTSPRPCRG